MHLFINISSLVTNEGLVSKNKFSKIDTLDLGILSNAWLAVKEGMVEDYGQGPIPKSYLKYAVTDLGQSLVLPGLVDSHAHPVFAGSRANEFTARLAGESYQQIAARGGGIASTIKATRAATRDELCHKTRENLKSIQAHGVTTIECKTGYGQSPQTELLQLEILTELQAELPLNIVRTYLGLHAKPQEIASTEEFVQLMTTPLKQIAQKNLADFVDAFVEEGYFNVPTCENYFNEAKESGLGIRIHADEFADAGAAAAAARWRAASADHLEECSEEGALAMATAGTIATLLPGTSLYTKIPYANASLFQKAGVPVAIATDFNPGSCRFHSLPFCCALGALNCGLTPAEAIAAVTWIPAKSLNLSDKCGALSRGYPADFLVHKAGDISHWLADFGQTLPEQIYRHGELNVLN